MLKTQQNIVLGSLLKLTLLSAGVGRDKPSESGHSVILVRRQQSSPIYFTNPLLCHSTRMHEHDFKYILSFQEEFMEQYKLKAYRLQYYKNFTCLQSVINSDWSFLSLLYSSSILCRSPSICSCIAKLNNRQGIRAKDNEHCIINLNTIYYLQVLCWKVIQYR